MATASNYTVATKYWHALDDGRVQCDLCPRFCKLREGQRGMCFVRARNTTPSCSPRMGAPAAFCIDPVEKKPLNHFSRVRPCSHSEPQGAISRAISARTGTSPSRARWRRSRRTHHPKAIARAAADTGCRAVAFTYNDPVIFMEYAIDVAKACHERGIATIAVTAGEICDEPRREFYQYMDAANVDLKAFTQDFYWKVCKGDLQTVLDTLMYLKRETRVWFEITTLLIPGKNDSDDELRAMSAWIMKELGPDVPLHFSAFHPDYRMLDVPPTPPETLRRARRIAREAGIHHVYVGNIHDEEGSSTYCAKCGEKLIGRDWYVMTKWNLTADGACRKCGEKLPGRIEAKPGTWGARRQMVNMRAFA
jgi:pyruvate formate lyase activating enzyme